MQTKLTPVRMSHVYGEFVFFCFPFSLQINNNQHNQHIPPANVTDIYHLIKTNGTHENQMTIEF